MKNHRTTDEATANHLREEYLNEVQIRKETLAKIAKLVQESQVLEDRLTNTIKCYGLQYDLAHYRRLKEEILALYQTLPVTEDLLQDMLNL